LSGDSEIVALGASGISRLQILKSTGSLSVVVAGIMTYLTFNVLPGAIHNLKDLKANQAVLFQSLRTQIKPRVFEEIIPKKVLYVEEIDRANNRWRNIFLADLSDNPDNPRIMTAESGYLLQGQNTDSTGEGSDQVELHAENGSLHQLGDPQDDKSGDRSDKGRKGEKRDSPGNQGKRKSDQEAPQNQPKYSDEKFGAMDIGLVVPQEREAESLLPTTDQESVAEMPWTKLIDYRPSAANYRIWLAEVHERLAFPAACLVFALLAVAFGISHVRTGRSFGLMLGLAITIAYYLLALSGKHNGVAGKVPVWLGIWEANIVLAVLGLAVLWFQRQPGWDPLSMLSSLQHIMRRKKEKAKARERSKESRNAAGAELDGPPGLLSKSKLKPGGDRSARKVLRRRFNGHRLIDGLVLSELTRFFIFILAGFSTLFLIITLFQLLDSITRNNIEASVVTNYLLFLIPYIVNYMAPMAALVAVMVTFGLLEKTSQVIVLKASGISIYRLAGPAIIASLFLSGLVFLNQDYVLPFTNRRQDNLYHMIRSGQRPAQTFYQTDHKWIFGGDSRIYNYSHFNPIDDSFARLTVLSLAKDPFAINDRIFAKRAHWDNATQTWVLENGWERRFQGDHHELQTFRERRITVPEGPEYFKREAKESSMMTLEELRQQIKTLARSGFDVLDLKIDLYSKIALPAACIVMMFVGLPFAFSVGKKGALYGVTIGIAIGLAYTGMQGLFQQMGRYEVLPPLLAAWGPNIMFAAGGIYLFLTSRT
ncbi:MAG: LptF/LptG family permease, partial [Blastocatellia bacterium]